VARGEALKNQTNHSQFPPARLSWSVWGLGAALYLIGFYQRVAPAVMTEELSRDFSLGAAALGNLSAFYFYSYVAMQIPTGILADRWGPRKLLAAGAFVAALGSLVFALSGDMVMAGIGRLLIGGSVAVAFVGMLKIASVWFAPRQFALATGLALFVGISGAVFAGVPLHLLVISFGWRSVMAVSAVLTFCIGVAIWIVVRDDPREKGFKSHGHGHGADDISEPGVGIVAGMKEVLKYRNTWLLILAPGGIVGCILTFSGLWGIPFLTTHYGMTTTSAATLTSVPLVAWAVSSPFFGALSDRFGKRKPFYLIGTLFVVLCWGVIIHIPGLPIPILTAALVVAGAASGGMIIGFAYGKESVPIHLAGTVSGMINMGVMVGPMILQPLVGWFLDLGYKGGVVDGMRVYEWAAYRAGFSIMLGWAVLAFLLLLFTKETHCRQGSH
jgi:MFS family permease